MKPNKFVKDIKAVVKQTTIKNPENEDQYNEILELESQLFLEQEKNKNLSETFKKNQEMYVKKEQINRKTLSDIEDKLRGRLAMSDTQYSSKTSKNMEKIQEIHKEIMEKLGIVQHKTVQIMIDQEKEIVKDYKDSFLSVETELARIRKNSLKKQPETNEFNLWKMIEKYSEKNKKIEIINDKLVEMNKNLKLDLNEQKNGIKSMKFSIDLLKLRNFNLKKELNLNRAHEFSGNSINVEKKIRTDRNYDAGVIENFKIAIENEKKKAKIIKNELCALQESTNELKYILKQRIQDVSNQIQSIFKHSVDREGIERLKEKNKQVSLLYDKTFPIRVNLSKRMLILPHNRINEIENTMEAIHSIYEDYEKNLKDFKSPNSTIQK